MTAPYDQEDLQREWARDDRTILNLRELITTDGGFTFDPTRGTLIEIGSTEAYAVGVPGTEHVIGSGESFVAAVRALTRRYAVEIADRDCVLGGWFSPERGDAMIELTEILDVSRAQAIFIGRARQQEAVLDLATGECIDTSPAPVITPAGLRHTGVTTWAA
jgi:hypothetical protein